MEDSSATSISTHLGVRTSRFHSCPFPQCLSELRTSAAAPGGRAGAVVGGLSLDSLGSPSSDPVCVLSCETFDKGGSAALQ